MLDDTTFSETDTALSPITDTTSQIQLISAEEQANISALVAARDKEELQAQLDLFNATQTKKNILRLTRLSGVLDKVDEQLISRLESRPDQISTKDVLEIMNAVSNQVERINNFNAKVADATKPSITAIQNKTEINVNVTPQLSRDEKAGVMDAVAALLKQLRQPVTTGPEISPSTSSASEAEFSTIPATYTDVSIEEEKE